MSEFSTRLKLSDKMIDILFNSKEYLYTWLEGSSQCGKSVTAALAMSLMIDSAGPEDNLFLALGYTVTSAKNNVFECGGFGVRYFFGSRCTPGKYMGQDCLKIKTKTGMKYLVAFGTNTKTANNSWHGWKVSGFVFDEIDRACQESITEMQQRITAVKDPHIIVTQNPNVPKHPIYEFLESLEKKGLVYYTHWVLDDNIGLTEEKIQQVKDRYDPGSIYFKRYVLGQRVSPEGQIYTVRDYNILEDFNPTDYIDYITVCDQGESLSASSFILAALKYDREKRQYEMNVLKNYYYKNDGKTGAAVKMFADTSRDYAQFIKECTELMGRYPSVCYIDMSPEFYRNCKNAFYENQLDPTILKYVLKDKVEERIKSGLNLLYTGKLKFYKGCSEVIDDFRNAVYDNKKIESTGKFERNKEYTEAGHLDSVDCCEYAFTHFKNKLYIS